MCNMYKYLSIGKKKDLTEILLRLSKPSLLNFSPNIIVELIYL